MEIDLDSDAGRTVVVVSGTRWPSVAELDDWADAGVAKLELRGPVAIGEAHAEETVRMICLLRDALARRVEVVWSCHVEDGFELAPLFHLPPPTEDSQGAGNELAVWRAGFAVGRFFWRLGPDFIAIKDTRPGGPSMRYTTAQPDLITLLRTLMTPSRDIDLTMDPRFLQALIDARIVLRVGDWFVTLPHRTFWWPVPCHAL